MTVKENMRTMLFLMIFLFAQQVSAQENNSNILLTIKAFNNNDQAIKVIENFASQKTENLTIKKEIGRSYYLTSDYKTATNYFININKQDKNLCNYELAQCYAVLNKPSFSIKYLQQYLMQKNKKPLSQIKSDESFNNINNSEEWIDLWNKNWYSPIELLYNDADYEYRIGKFEESIEILEKLSNKKPSFDEAHYLLAKNYIKLNLNSHAINAIDKALKIAPENQEYLFLKSSLLNNANKQRKALKGINNTIRIDSSNIDYYILRAEIYLNLQKIDFAKKEIDNVLNFNQSANTYLIAGNIYTQSGDYLKALKFYNSSLHKNPNNTRIFILRGDVYRLTKTLEFAEKDYSMALDFYPDEGEIYYKRGLVRVQQKKYAEACSDFNKARNFGYMKAEEMIRIYCR